MAGSRRKPRTSKLLLKQQLTSPFHQQISLTLDRVNLLRYHLEFDHYSPVERAAINAQLALAQAKLQEAHRMFKLQQKFPFSLLPAADQEEVDLRRANNHPVTQEEIDLAIASTSSQD